MQAIFTVCLLINTTRNNKGGTGLKITEIFDAIKRFYESIDVWTIAIKQDDVWVNYYTKIMPTSEPFSGSTSVIETDRIIVLHESHKVDDFARILEALKSNVMTVCGVKICFSVADNFLDYNINYSDYEWTMDQFRTEYLLYRYEVRPSSTPNFPNNLEVELWSLNKPYKDKEDIMREFLRIKSSDYNWGSVYILLPVFLSLKKCYFEQNSLQFTIKFHNKMADQLAMGFILRDSKGATKRYTKSLNKDKLTFSGDFCRYEDSEHVEADIISADVFIYHRKIPFIARSKEAVRYGLSSSLELFKNFWSEEYLLNCLNGENGDKAFEWSLATLLTFCGFKVLWVGWGKGRVELGGADLLALYQDTITVAECTIGTIKNEKIDKLLKATRIVEETLGLEDKSAEKIFSLLFTCSDISSATMKSCKDSGVRIIGPKEIEQIFDAIKRNKPTREKVRLVRGEYHYYV